MSLPGTDFVDWKARAEAAERLLGEVTAQRDELQAENDRLHTRAASALDEQRRIRKHAEAAESTLAEVTTQRDRLEKEATCEKCGCLPFEPLTTGQVRRECEDCSATFTCEEWSELTRCTACHFMAKANAAESSLSTARTTLEQVKKVIDALIAHDDGGENAEYCWWCSADINGKNSYGGHKEPHRADCIRVRVETLRRVIDPPENRQNEEQDHTRVDGRS